MGRNSIVFGMILLLSMFNLEVRAQEIKIKSFSLQMEPMTVPIQRKDNNGNICALVKVIIPSSQAVFEGSLVGNCDFKTSEYWCYLSPGSKLLKVKYPHCEPLMVNFESIIGSGLKGGSIYEMVLSVPSENVIEISGNPIKINYSKEASPIAYLNDMGVHSDKKSYYDSTWGKQQRGNDKIDTVRIILKSEKGIIKSEFNLPLEKIDEYLLSGVEENDVLTICADNDSYAEAVYTISNQNIKDQFVPILQNKKRVEIKGILMDSVSNKPINNGTVNLFHQGAEYNSLLEYHIYAYYNSFPMEFNKNGIKINQNGKMEHRSISPIRSCRTNDAGEFLFPDCMENYIYFIDVIPPDGYLIKSGNDGINYCYHKSNSKDFIIKVSPNTLYGVITDGKNPIKGAKIECDALYGNIFYSDNDGKFIIKGYKNGKMRIISPKYMELQLNPLPSYDKNYSHEYKINLRKGKPGKILSGHYSLEKNKVIYDK